MRYRSAQQVRARKVAELGLDPALFDLTSTEAIAAALRRAAGFLCPCAAPTLLRAALQPLDGIVSDLDAITELVEATLDAMTAHGDLLEQRDVTSETGRPGGVLLYAAPPSFVPRHSGAALLIGVAPDQTSPLPDELEARIEYVQHIRRLPADAAENLQVELAQFGLIELTDKTWLKAPRVEKPADHIALLDKHLDGAPAAIDIPGMTLLDTEQPVRYYRGRWTKPRSHTGRYVARRSQAYGADLWCYVQVRDGRPERFIDLPLVGSRMRGCDEAWRLQMALDARRGEPQRFRLRRRAGAPVLEFFSPVPLWARRRWDAFGMPVQSPGCLFAYQFAESELSQELLFIRDALWLAEIAE